MKIESLIKREGGTEITMGDKTYLFAPDDSGKHVCDVADKAHIETFLAITEGFVSTEPAKAAKPAA